MVLNARVIRVGKLIRLLAFRTKPVSSVSMLITHTSITPKVSLSFSVLSLYVFVCLLVCDACVYVCMCVCVFVSVRKYIYICVSTLSMSFSPSSCADSSGENIVGQWVAEELKRSTHRHVG